MASHETAAMTVRQVVERAAEAADARWRDDGPRRAEALRAIARGLDARRAEITALCAAETALYEAELAPEFDRMVGTLRMFAELVETDAWRRPVKDGLVAAVGAGATVPSGSANAAPPLIGPDHDVRSIMIPLGEVVAVFGASNFPLAYGVCGGDTASALAAGCAVVVKEHPAHVKTGRLIASIAQAAIADAGGSPDLLGYVLNDDPQDFNVAKELVQQPRVCAVGFTGSKGGGLALERLARERTDIGLAPIAVFAEMGSVNPVLVLPGAMATRAEAIADELAESVFSRFGQQCTKPGLVFFARDQASDSNVRFTKRLAERFRAGPARAMLAPWIAKAYDAHAGRVEETRHASLEAFSDASAMVKDGAPGRGVRSRLWGTTLDDWKRHEVLREECFGPSLKWVQMDDWEQGQRMSLGAHLTMSVYVDAGDPRERELLGGLLRVHAGAAGRVIFNGVPTGVRVCAAMVHGGPYPATNQPHTTAVGPRAIERWCRPVCFQNAPRQMLPAALR